VKSGAGAVVPGRGQGGGGVLRGIIKGEPSSPLVSAVNEETAWLGGLLLVRMVVVVAGLGLLRLLLGGGRRKAFCIERDAKKQLVARKRALKVLAMSIEGWGRRDRLLLMIIFAVVVLIGPGNAGRAYVRV